MHYVICYDIENDRLREKTAKLLARHGCLRVQKSVFAGPYMEKKHFVRLQLALRQSFARKALAPGDSLLIIPLREEYAADIVAHGTNNISPAMQEKPLKILL